MVFQLTPPWGLPGATLVRPHTQKYTESHKGVLGKTWYPPALCGCKYWKKHTHTYTHLSRGQLYLKIRKCLVKARTSRAEYKCSLDLLMIVNACDSIFQPFSTSTVNIYFSQQVRSWYLMSLCLSNVVFIYYFNIYCIFYIAFISLSVDGSCSLSPVYSCDLCVTKFNLG